MNNLALTERTAERFWSKVEKTETCWNWIGGGVGRGYGSFWVAPRHYLAHRVSFATAHGSIPEGMVIDHKCHNHSCVNPDHLQAVTPKQNAENRAGPMKTSQTGVRGVHPKGRKFRAAISVGGKPFRLGLYDTIAEAEQAVIEARLSYYTNSLTDKIPAAG